MFYYASDVSNVHPFEAGESKNLQEQAFIMGYLVRRMREAAELSQDQLATRCGVTPSFISSLENGTALHSIEKTWDVCNTLGLHYGRLTELADKLVALNQDPGKHHPDGC